MVSLLVLLHYLLKQCFIFLLVGCYASATSKEELIKLYTKYSLIKLYIQVVYAVHLMMLFPIANIFSGLYWVSWDIINWMDVIISESSSESKAINRFFKGLNRSKSYDD